MTPAERYPWARRVEWRLPMQAGWGDQPREAWGPGPWQDEPDLIEWRHQSGLPCLLVRNAAGALCGYVGLPPVHRYWGRHYNSVQEESSHGGLTFSDECHGDICHVPEPGEPGDIWWLGFDCAHYQDLAPAMAAMMRKHRHTLTTELGQESGARAADLLFPSVESYKGRGFFEEYRDVGYVRAHCEALADELVHGSETERKLARRGLLTRWPVPGYSRERWFWSFVAGAKRLVRVELPEMWRRIFLDLDSMGRGPKAREALQNGGLDSLGAWSRARRRDRP